MPELLLDVGTPEGVADALMNHGATPGMLRGVTPQEMEDLGRAVETAIGAGQHAQALEGAAFLVQHDPWQRPHLLALATCLQHLGQYEDAGRFYAQALLMDATDAACAFRIGECLGAMRSLDEAREAFEAAVKLSWLPPGQETVRLRAQERLDLLTQLGA